MNSIDYYNKNSQAFYARTIHADLKKVYEKFFQYLNKKGRILDAGCGVGRDSKYFLSQGYEVVAFDGSVEMVKLTSTLLEQEALHMRFEDLDFSDEFDAVWASASLLHIPYEDLRKTIQSFHQSLRSSGILYASFKYGSSMRQLEDRTFFDMNETTIKPYLGGLFDPLEIWKSEDTRTTAAPTSYWLNFIAKRI
jgi:SAM-dependent methyltransferase